MDNPFGNLTELEKKALRYISNKEIIAEKKADNVNIIEDIESEMLKTGQSELVVHVPFSDEKAFILIKLRNKKKKSLDKAALAQQAEVDKTELDSYGISKLTEEGVLTPQMIKDNTHEEKVREVKIKKKKPREGKKSK